jgi:hypothetical protein
MQMSPIAILRMSPGFDASKWTAGSEVAEAAAREEQFNIAAQIGRFASEHALFVTDATLLQARVCLQRSNAFMRLDFFRFFLSPAHHQTERYRSTHQHERRPSGRHCCARSSPDFIVVNHPYGTGDLNWCVINR